jgi:uncharacterized protein (UPF0128 family)
LNDQDFQLQCNDLEEEKKNQILVAIRAIRILVDFRATNIFKHNAMTYNKKKNQILVAIKATKMFGHSWSKTPIVVE